MMGVRISGRNKQYVLGLIIALSGVLLLCVQIVKADDVGVDNSSDLQGMLNENSAVVQNAPSTESTPVNTIAPLSATITESGTFGTCDWDIDDTGLLTIHAGVLGKQMGNWITDGKMNDTITNVICDPGVVANEDSSSLFFGLKNVKTIDVSNMDTSKVHDMHGMFYYDIALVSLDVSAFDTSNVTDMNSMFYTDAKLVDLSGLEKWDTGKVQNFSSIFYSLPLTSFASIEKWDMSSATNISGMFSMMTKLTSLDLSSWNVSNVQNMGSLFYFCESLTSLKGLAQWDYHNVTTIKSLFYGNTHNPDIRSIEGWDTSKITDMSGVFDYCLRLDYLDLSKWDTSNVTDMKYMFDETPMLTEIKGITNFNTSKVTSMMYMFAYCGVPELDLSSFDTSNVTDMRYMFNRSLCTNIKGNFDTSSVTDMTGIFTGSSISDFESIDLNVLNWNVSKCKNFSSAFSSMPNVTSLDLSKWVMTSATTLDGMFQKDPKLVSVDSSTWSMPNLTSLLNVFLNDSSIDTLDLSSWNVSKVTDMRSLFYNDSNLRELNLSGWDTSKVTNMYQMFAINNNLWKLTLGPKTKLLAITNSSGTIVGASFPTPPAKNTEISDPSTEQKYYSISNRWQEVDYDNGGTDHNPDGELFSSGGLNTTTRTDDTTYVWQQQPYMDVSMDVPDLSYGTAFANQGITPREQSNWAITLNNNVYPVTALNTTISVNMEKPLANSVGDTLDDSFIFRDNSGKDSVISTTPTTIYDGKLANGTKSLSWDSKHGFLMDLHSYQTPMGNYSTTLDWTMVNSV